MNPDHRMPSSQISVPFACFRLRSCLYSSKTIQRFPCAHDGVCYALPKPVELRIPDRKVDLGRCIPAACHSPRVRRLFSLGLYPPSWLTRKKMPGIGKETVKFSGLGSSSSLKPADLGLRALNVGLCASVTASRISIRRGCPHRPLPETRPQLGKETVKYSAATDRHIKISLRSSAKTSAISAVKACYSAFAARGSIAFHRPSE